MKKKLLHRVLLLFVSGAMLAGVSGCKDYDDDIDNINNRLDELTTGKIASIESQLGSLQTTVTGLESLSEQVASIAGKIDGLATDGDVQTAIDNALAELKEQLGDTYVTGDLLNTTLLGYATTQSVGDIAGRVSDLESEIGKLASSEDLADQLTKIRGEIETAKNAAVKAAGEACKAAFQTSFDAAVAKAGLVDATEMQDAIDAYDAKIKKYIADAVANGGLINQQIASQISAAVTELESKISGRLTSVQLIPELYVDGIETIELKSLAYKAWKVTSTSETESVAQGTAVSTTAQSATAVRYLVSPSVITVDDIKAPSYVFEKAETRAAVSTELMSVEDWSVANGVLTVDVKKRAGASLELDADHIYTAALKVPIADKHLTNGESGTAVYSDYVRITETTVEPRIAALVDKGASKPNDGEWECSEEGTHYHFSATFEAAKESNPAKLCAYNDKVDLLSLVTGCYTDAKGAHEITKAALAASGLEFRFSIPTKSFKIGENETDQQQFATVAAGEDGAWTLSSKLPGGVTDNQAAIDKTPIVRVELVDVNNGNAVADVRYFKVQWVREAVDAVDLGVLKTFEYTLGCDIFSGDMLWSEMVDDVLAKLGSNGMSQNEFLATYDIPEIEAEDHKVGNVDAVEADGVELYYNFDVAADESAAAFVWSLTPEQIGTVMDITGKQTVAKKSVNVTIPAKNKYQGAISFSLVVNIKLPVLPAIYGYDFSFWYTDKELANVYPVQYNRDDIISGDIAPTCEYNYELDRLFSDSRIVKNLLPCGKWDVQFALDQPTDYKPAMTAEPAGNGDNSGYLLNKGLETAVKLNYYNMASGNWYAPETGKDGAVNVAPESDIRIWVENNEAGIGILKNNATLKVWSAVNPYNLYQVTKFDVHFVEPLKINRQLKDAYFVDQVVSGSPIDCSKAFTMTDFKDYIVAEVTTGTAEKEKYAAELYEYYGVTDVKWDRAAAKVNLKKDASGNYVVDDSMTAENATTLAADRFGDNCIREEDNGATLRFFNINGVKVEKTVKLFIPVTVSHKWGTVSETVTVELRPEE